MIALLHQYKARVLARQQVHINHRRAGRIHAGQLGGTRAQRSAVCDAAHSLAAAAGLLWPVAEVRNCGHPAPVHTHSLSQSLLNMGTVVASQLQAAHAASCSSLYEGAGAVDCMVACELLAMNDMATECEHADGSPGPKP